MTRLDKVLLVITGITIGMAIFVWVRPGGTGGQMLAHWRSQLQWQHAFQASRASLDNLGYRSSVTASTTVYEFFDYQCPYCRIAASTVEIAEDSGFVNVVYLHYPLPNHLAARGSALASMCAAEQGRFQQMHAHFLTTDQWMTDTNWVREARIVGISDTLRFVRCLSDVRTSARLDSSISFATALGVTGTPSFMTGSRMQLGVVSLDGFKEMR